MRRARWFVFIMISIAALPQLAWAVEGHGKKLGITDIEEIFSLKDGLETDHLAKLNDVLSHLEKRQAKYRSTDDFVEYLYYYTHQKLLKNYTKYPTIKETLSLGNYDCLTATAVYSVLLNELNIDHDVIETNYHIYILVHPDNDHDLLIETTDPHNGFVVDQQEIAQLRKTYADSNLEIRNTLIDFNFNIERELEQKEIIGLLYYNQSIRQLNEGHWDQARIIANQALEYYSNTRVTSLINIIDSASF